MLEQFARDELARLVKPDDDGTQIAINRDIMELVSAFSHQGHSGSTAPYAAALFSRLIAYKPLGPLTGDADEWVNVAEQEGVPIYQNKRRGTVFKEGEHGQAYDIEGKVFRDPDGSTWTGSDSRVNITFPYIVPDEPEIVDRPWQWPKPVRIDNLATNERGWLFMEGNLSVDKPFTVGLYPGEYFVRGVQAEWTELFGTFYEGRDYFDRAVRHHGKPPAPKSETDDQPAKSLLREATRPDETKPPPPPGTSYKPRGFA